jgi:hypothetical protein
MGSPSHSALKARTFKIRKCMIEGDDSDGREAGCAIPNRRSSRRGLARVMRGRGGEGAGGIIRPSALWALGGDDWQAGQCGARRAMAFCITASKSTFAASCPDSPRHGSSAVDVTHDREVGGTTRRAQSQRKWLWMGMRTCPLKAVPAAGRAKAESTSPSSDGGLQIR